MLIFPKTINADGLLPFLGQLAEHADVSELRLDFTGLQRVSPAGLAALTAFMVGRERKRLATNVAGLESCGIRDYLRRMNLLRLCGWEHGDESFARRDPSGRFVPLEEIPHRVEDLGARIAACIAPGGEDYESPNAGLYDAAWYLIDHRNGEQRPPAQPGHGFCGRADDAGGWVREDCHRGLWLWHSRQFEGGGFPVGSGSRG